MNLIIETAVSVLKECCIMMMYIQCNKLFLCISVFQCCFLMMVLGLLKLETRYQTVIFIASKVVSSQVQSIVCTFVMYHLLHI